MHKPTSRFRKMKSRFFQKTIFREQKTLTVQKTYTDMKTLTKQETLTDKHSFTIVMPLIIAVIFSAMVVLRLDILMMGFEKLYRLLETALTLV